MIKFLATAAILVATVVIGSAGVYNYGYGHRDGQRVTIVPDRQTTGLDSKRYADAFIVTQTAADVAASRPRAYEHRAVWPTINDMGTRYLNDAWGYVAPRVHRVAKAVHHVYYARQRSGAPITGQGRAPNLVQDCVHSAFPQCGDSDLYRR